MHRFTQYKDAIPREKDLLKSVKVSICICGYKKNVLLTLFFCCDRIMICLATFQARSRCPCPKHINSNEDETKMKPKLFITPPSCNTLS